MNYPPPPTKPQPKAGAAGGDAVVQAVGDAFRLPCVITRPADGRVLYANAALLALLGMAAPYLLGECVDRIFFDEREARVRRDMWHRGEGPEQSPVQLRTEGGNPRNASLIVGTVAMGIETLAVLILLPITADEAGQGRPPCALRAVADAAAQLGEDNVHGATLEQLEALLIQSP